MTSSFDLQKMSADLNKFMTFVPFLDIYNIENITSFISAIKSNNNNIDGITLPAPYNFFTELILQNPDYTALEILIEVILQFTQETGGGTYYCIVNFVQVCPPFKNITKYATFLLDHYQDQMTDEQLFQVMRVFNTNQMSWESKMQVYTKYHYTQGLLELYNGPIYRLDEEAEGELTKKEEQRQLIFLQFKKQDQELKQLKENVKQLKENIKELNTYIDQLEHSPDPGPKYLAAKIHFENC